ncbi:hypothetical protein CHS0354_001571 [Potamilus streckersoni]|uniref:Calsyntenin C-terminal domain-containing protein n=1 Tax=Potamilus streckersoni TaxID=2493646 RepID=A0AAE0SIR3_9BIVA|nr:hypothetical protein CHS0354_001571 [Potamilus streckersoni]
MYQIYTSLIIICAAGYTSSTSEPNAFAPVLKSSYKNEKGIPLFEGRIFEDETLVRFDQPITATDDDEVGGAKFICGYKITSSKHFPFIMELKNRLLGSVDIKVKEGRCLSYDKRRNYKFNIVAYDCGEVSLESNRAVVHIEVEKSSNFSAKFDENTYFVEMDEGQLYDPLLHVQAYEDSHCTSSQGTKSRAVCSYEIVTPDVPFSIDKKGYIRNTEEVSYKERHNFILEVVATNCGSQKSRPAFVNIQIREKCKSGWIDIPEHTEYIPLSGKQKVAESAHLKLCKQDCIPDKINVHIKLATKHIGKGCDRDTYAVTSQRKICGADGDSIDLLPTPSPNVNWTLSLPTDDGQESDRIFAFDGHSNAVEIPSGHVGHKLTKEFTLSTWMKHSYPDHVDKDGKSEKEQILCMSDGDNMNRHHYSWFIHNGKLIFLLRREAEDVDDLQVFKPAEWRWHLPQVNDGEWHHYAISGNGTKMTLYMDGQTVIADDDNEEIIDDWPLHPTDRVHFTKLVVGACWRGGDKKYVQYLKGYLAGLTILKGKMESSRVIKCLNSCQENLDFNALQKMSSGTAVSFNNEMTEFSIMGTNATEVEGLLQEVTYSNGRAYPTPGRRNLSIKTSVHCGHTEEILGTVQSYVFVQPTQSPIITISGKKLYHATPTSLRAGDLIFRDIIIEVDTQLQIPDKEVDIAEDDEVEEAKGPLYTIDNNSSGDKQQRLEYKMSKTLQQQDTKAKNDAKNTILLDRCMIRTEPQLNLHVEHLTLPQDLMIKFNMRLEGSETNAGLVIINADQVKNYETVIQGIQYVHQRGEDINSRTFIISCSSQNGRFNSNEMEVQVMLVSEEPVQLVHAHAQIQQHDLQMDKMSGLNVAPANVATNNFGMIAIIVVCVGFLLFMIVLGIFRIRAAHRRTQVVQVDEKQEMEWDNSELNITVNPMDQELFEYEENGVRPLRDDSDTEDDVESFHDDKDSSEEDENENKTLEWDDSTLSY